MYHSLEDQKEINDGLLKISKQLDIPVVATNDAHYLTRKDAAHHDIMLCIQTNSKVEDEDRFKYGSDEFYLKSYQEMEELFGDIPYALKNTVKIADKCNVEISTDYLKNYVMPDFDVPSEYKQKNKKLTLIEDYFEDLCDIGFEKLIINKANEEVYRKRLKHELKIIAKMKFPQYFLIVQDFVNWAKNNDIPIGPGRGSAAGSLVSYLLGITMVDPIEFGLLFERFLNPHRVGLPDIDIDICYEERERVLEYLREKYGFEHVAQIATISKMGPKASIRDVGRALDIPLAEVDRISKLVPDMVRTFEEAFKKEPKLRQAAAGAKYKRLFDAAVAIHGSARHISIHASGIVISQSDITETVPCWIGKKGELVTQFDKDFIEKVGLVKWDLLGLKTLTVIHKCCKAVKKNIDPDFDINKIQYDDKKTFKLFSSGAAAGVFQLDGGGYGGGMKDLFKKLNPDNIEDVCALIALYRPGPLGSGMIDNFISRKHGKTKIQYPHESLEPILKDTYGVIVYQEQVMQISNVMGGYSLGEADLLRRAMGKKKAGEMAKQRESFIDGARKMKIPDSKATKVFVIMEHFAGYGFNKSHSAAYAFIAYQTAYLKAHYPAYFMAALMTVEGNKDKVVEYIKDCRNMKIKVLPPDINYSEDEFVVVNKDIRFGLGAIKNVGSAAISNIIAEREVHGEYKTLLDFLERINLASVNKKNLESLILCGALDSLKIYRNQLMKVLEQAVKEALRRNNERKIGQFSLFSSNDGSTTNFDEEFIKYPDIEEMDEIERLRYEKELMGLYITGHPIEKYQKIIDDYHLTTISEIKNMDDSASVVTVGLFETMNEGKTRNDFKKMMKGVFEDMTGRIYYNIWEPAVSKNEKYLDIGKVLLVIGRIDTKRGEHQLIIKSVFPMEQARKKLTKKIHIKLNSIGLEELFLKKLRDVIEGSPGQTPLYLHINSEKIGEIIIKPHSKLNVSITKKLLAGLTRLVGEDKVLFNQKT